MPESMNKNQGADLASGCERLERILRDQIELHRKLESCIERKKDAIRKAQIDSIRMIYEEENVHVQAIGDLEKDRLMLVGELTESIRPDSNEPLTVLEIAEVMSEEQGARLIELRDLLRDLVKQVRRGSSVVRIASEKLNRHMIGILQTVRTALSGAGVYERKGQVALGAQLEFSVDVRS